MTISLLKCQKVNACERSNCILKQNQLYTIAELDFYARTKKDYYCKKFQCMPRMTIVQKLKIDGKVLIEATNDLNNAEVKLLPGRYSAHESNPVIDSVYECTGILSIDGAGSSYCYNVDWYNGTSNTYREGDLIAINGKVEKAQCISIWNEDIYEV